MATGTRDRFAAPREVDVLIPTRNRPVELAATLAGLAAQTCPFGVVVSDQSSGGSAWLDDAVAGMVRILRHLGHPVLLTSHLPRRGLAEHRAHLLAQSRARRVLFLDDDVWLEPGTIERMVTALDTLGCGLVGSFPHGLSYADDHRPEQEASYEEWRGKPQPERLRPRGPEWARARLHSAANLLHVTERLRLRPGEWRAYKIAWIGACAMYDRLKLLRAGGFDFWPELPPEHSGEDVLAQLRVIRRFGGAGIVPSGAYHLQTPTTVSDREVECFDVVPVGGGPTTMGDSHAA